MKKFPQLASRNPRRTERKHIPHFALSQISSPYDLAIGKLAISYLRISVPPLEENQIPSTKRQNLNIKENHTIYI